MFTCVYVCVLFCVGCFVDWYNNKPNNTKLQLREEIKSNFFSRNSQLISNSTTRTHTDTRREQTLVCYNVFPILARVVLFERRRRKV